MIVASKRRYGQNGKARPADIPERLLGELWKRRAALRAEFRTESGRRVRVLYPGRPGTAAGPDFRDAVLELEDVGIVRGDVELHLRQRDWDSHGHGRDPNYNGVVVHGVLQSDSADTLLPSGQQQAPVVSLASLLDDGLGDAVGEWPGDGPANALGAAPGPWGAVSGPKMRASMGLWGILAQRGVPAPKTADEAGSVLDRAGEQRFLFKAGRFSRFLLEQNPEQTLYEGLMEGLGYGHNRQPFAKLA